MYTNALGRSCKCAEQLQEHLQDEGDGFSSEFSCTACKKLVRMPPDALECTRTALPCHRWCLGYACGKAQETAAGVSDPVHKRCVLMQQQHWTPFPQTLVVSAFFLPTMFCHADMRPSTARPMVRMCRHIYTMMRS